MKNKNIIIYIIKQNNEIKEEKKNIVNFVINRNTNFTTFSPYDKFIKKSKFCPVNIKKSLENII